MEFMLKKLKQWWNKLNKYQKIILICIVWLLNIFIYLSIPKSLYILKTFPRIVSYVCGFLLGILIMEKDNNV